MQLQLKDPFFRKLLEQLLNLLHFDDSTRKEINFRDTPNVSANGIFKPYSCLEAVNLPISLCPALSLLMLLKGIWKTTPPTRDRIFFPSANLQVRLSTYFYDLSPSYDSLRSLKTKTSAPFYSRICCVPKNRPGAWFLWYPSIPPSHTINIRLLFICAPEIFVSDSEHFISVLGGNLIFLAIAHCAMSCTSVCDPGFARSRSDGLCS